MTTPDRGLTPEEDIALGCFESGTITEVTPYTDGGGWSVAYGEMFGCGVKDVGTEPKVGDELTTFGRFGRPFHGQALNGTVLWYSSPAEMDAAHKAMVEAMEAQHRAEFEVQREQLDRDYDGLPPLFKMRIDRFRNANPDFRWKHEHYEMFVCTQAVVLAEWARAQVDTSAPGWKDRGVEIIEAWVRINSKENDPPYDYAAQRDAVPGWEDGHSGNTFGCAVALAKEHLRAPERVAIASGALAPLVGSVDYSEPIA